MACSFTAMSGFSKASSTRVILILGMLTALGPFSIDMYLPAFPEIAHSLHTSVAQVMLSLSSFFIGISVGQVIYGPLLERLGRKRPLYAGLALYIVASVGCATVGSAEALLWWRLVQALGSCAGLVASRAMVRDLFDVKDNARIFSTLMLVVAVSPIIAPTLGGYVTAWLGWRAVFIILLMIALLIMVGVHFWLPESKQPDANYSLRPGAIVSNFGSILRHPQFYTYALTGAIAYGGLTAYISGSPDVFMQLYQFTEQQYGWVFAFVATGIIGASQLNTLVLRRASSQQIIAVALVAQCTVGLVLAAAAFWGPAPAWLLIGLIFLFLCCQGFLFPNASALSMAPFGHTAGSASAMMGAIQMSIGATSSALVSYALNGTAVPMAGMMAACSAAALAVFFVGQNLVLQRASKKAVAEEDVHMIETL